MCEVYRCTHHPSQRKFQIEAVEYHQWAVDEYGVFLEDYGCDETDRGDVVCPICGRKAFLSKDPVKEEEIRIQGVTYWCTSEQVDRLLSVLKENAYEAEESGEEAQG